MKSPIVLSSFIYPHECLQDTVATYKGLCSVRIVEQSTTAYSIEIRRTVDVVDEQQLANEFLNYLLNLSLEKHLSEFQEGDGTNRV
jgi:hypothetical protein